MYFLCKDGNAELVKEFIEAGADVNSPGCLQVALETYNNDVAQILIDHGCDVNKVNVLITEDKFALLWGEAQKKIAYSYPKVTYSYPKVT